MEPGGNCQPRRDDDSGCGTTNNDLKVGQSLDVLRLNGLNGASSPLLGMWNRHTPHLTSGRETSPGRWLQFVTTPPSFRFCEFANSAHSRHSWRRPLRPRLFSLSSAFLFDEQTDFTTRYDSLRSLVFFCLAALSNFLFSRLPHLKRPRQLPSVTKTALLPGNSVGSFSSSRFSNSFGPEKLDDSRSANQKLLIDPAYLFRRSCHSSHFQHERPDHPTSIRAFDLPRPFASGTALELFAAREGGCVLHDLGLQRLARGFPTGSMIFRLTRPPL